MQCCVNIEVLQKVDKELLLVALICKAFVTLVDSVLLHGFMHGKYYGRHLGDNSGKTDTLVATVCDL